MSLNRNDAELGKFTETMAVRVADDALALRFDQYSSTVIYLASGIPGALDSDAKWQIKRIDVGSTAISIKFASPLFDQIWNNRLGLTYV
jgi:hypothetical protein